MRRPRVVIAGERSGVGKSTITVGILLELKKRGLDPQPFKAGPDFLDPMHHSALLDRKSRNLDTWMFPQVVPELFYRASEGAGISIIEGVMGMYDGRDGRSEEGSTAHLAKMLKTPVILVLDASSSARSVGAVALGFKEYDPKVDLRAVIFNNIGGKRHLDMLRDSLRDIECLGGIPFDANAKLQSRQLGLEFSEENASQERYENIRNLIESNINIDRLIEIAASAPDMEVATSEKQLTRPVVRIGVAFDEAFNFYYEDNLQYLRDAGAELVFFSLLRDNVPDVDGLYVGGGYPELFADKLSSNKSARLDIKKLSDEGMPIYAEGGGLLYLCRSLITTGGEEYNMTGVFDATACMTEKLQALGYVEVKIIQNNILSRIGDSARGHVFHYSKIINSNENFAYDLENEKGICGSMDALICDKTMASYSYLHFGSNPRLANNFVEACQVYSNQVNRT
ncbi:MAG: hydrogenobyrinic acid a,c-diamide synthase (glutamine-hydrolyzing) [Euryarchaeota archaeon]|nr:hydrogenobyrinic acid a,c-diamide synthase (glutamine-hydrolyzing) [Euryarchaeota archaeon]